MAPSSTMNTVQSWCVWRGYAWRTKRAWNTSEMPGTAGFHARTHSSLGVERTSRTYKTVDALSSFAVPRRNGRTMGLSQAIALVTFVAVGSGSPGPNNTLLLASGVAFGFRRTLPHVIGTSVGMALLVGIAATSEGILLRTLPNVQVGLKVLASAYLVYLAARLAGGLSLGGATVQRPFGVPRAALFQFVNPKAWIFALALVSAYAPSGDAPIAVGAAIFAVSVVIAATAALWALGGTTLHRALESERARRTAGPVLGALLLASVAFLWL
jgi:threonine/homoserine/homoserine lactone efflux protein